MHIVAENAFVIRRRRELIVSGIAAQFHLKCGNQLVAIDLKRPFARPQFLNYFQTRVITPGLNCEKSASWRKAPHQRCEYFFSLEFGRHPSAPWLRRQNQIVALEYAAGLRNHGFEQEFMIIAIDHKNRWPNVARIAGLRTGLGLPTVSERWSEFFDLFGILMCGGSGQPHFLPVERRRCL